MATTIGNLWRLTKAGLVLGQNGAQLLPTGMAPPWPVRVARIATLPIRLLTWPLRWRVPPDRRLAAAFTSLGPSYIKLGQFLATRGDLIGPDRQRDLAHLQDRLPPFSMADARAAVEATLGGRLEDHFVRFGPPIAAASIAQVHQAEVLDADGTRRTVAVKILRPGVERRFAKDLASWRFGAGLIERFVPMTRRLRPLAVVETLKRATDLEMDLRLEAAAISEMAANIQGDPGFRVPAIDWRRTGQRVMTLEWIDGMPIGDVARLRADGHDVKALGLTVLQSFLRHAMRDGFFHGDMHQGNLLVDKTGTVVAVDFGLVGRLGTMERRFLAEILHGLITRDYRRAAQVHFDAGYVPAHHQVDVFAQAMRAIGEPIHGRTAEEISMADLLGQLFAYTDVFDMETRPELIMLQKSMVIVEGVARGLDPALNMWTAAEPIAKAWLEDNLGLASRLRDAGESAGVVGRLLTDLPRVVAQAERTADAIAAVAREGVRLNEASIQRLSRAEAAASRWRTFALWVGAAALVAIALHGWRTGW
jgi:ubiquinone biosynthesis protein